SRWQSGSASTPSAGPTSGCTRRSWRRPAGGRGSPRADPLDSRPVSLEHVDPPELYPGAPYHYATIASAGRMVFAAGACPIDASGRVPDPGDLEAQAALAVRNLETALTAAG